MQKLYAYMPLKKQDRGLIYTSQSHQLHQSFATQINEATKTAQKAVAEFKSTKGKDSAEKRESVYDTKTIESEPQKPRMANVEKSRSQQMQVKPSDHRLN